jgi:hypothetical protein
MSDFTRNLLAMKMKDDLRAGLNRKLEAMRKNMESILEMRQWNDPKFKKDYERSTWFLNDTKYNYKMNNWVENFHIKERYLKIKK